MVGFLPSIPGSRALSDRAEFPIGLWEFGMPRKLGFVAV
jgi:hypothetical protein